MSNEVEKPRMSLAETWLWGLGAVLLPFILYLPGLLIQKGLHPYWPWVCFFSGIIAGSVCVWKLMDGWTRVLALIVYIPGVSMFLIIFSFQFVCSMYHRCL